MAVLPIAAGLAAAAVALGALAAAYRAPDAAAATPSIAAAFRNLIRPRFAQYTPRGRAFALAGFVVMWAAIGLLVVWFLQ